MIAKQLKKAYIDFFTSKDHKLIPNVSLLPENDPTALFTSAGMHPLVPYLLGEPHPLGKRLVSVQRCLRTDDIDEVGDNVHHTFFEMLGNWSLGDYFKKEMIPWSFDFLTSPKYLGIPKEKLAVSVFAGDNDAPFDNESFDLWRSLGISDTRIAKLPKKNNWWGPVGLAGPCGPDTEMFYWAGRETAPENFDPNDPRWVEIWNDVFMEFNKTEGGTYAPLKQKNVDTGMGMERTLAVLNGFGDNYETDPFKKLILNIQAFSRKQYEGENKKSMRIITDHLRASVFLIADGVEPSNKDRGYVLRRLIRRAIRFGQNLGIGQIFLGDLAEKVVDIYEEDYPELKENLHKIKTQIELEEIRFQNVLQKGLKEIEKQQHLDGKIAFDLYQSYGFPWEMTAEIAKERGQQINKQEFEEEFKKHQELSKTTSAGMFKGGLADQSETVTKYHTATHLLQAALRQVLGSEVRQKGSNLTVERLRFDFSHPEKLTQEQLSEVERVVNEQIDKNLEVKMEIMDFERAVQSGALTVPGEKYPEKVKIYSVGDFSKEVCGGPHVDFTGKLGRFKIIKEEGAGAGIRRIYAKLA